ncbi:MAG: twin-arginine translocase subunit TatC [Halobacteriales archaeon]
MAGDPDEPSAGEPSDSDGARSPDDGAGEPAEGADGPTADDEASTADVSVDDVAPSDDGPKTCAGTTQEGEPCGRRVSEENDYCYLHRDQSPEDADEANVAEGDALQATPVSQEPVSESTYDAFEPAAGPAADQEMPLADHIEEMLKRLAVVVAVAGLVSLVTFPFAERLLNLLWNGILPAGEVTRPRLYGILELKLTELKVASLVGVILALPVLVYETYQFMKPGLYPHERRYYLAAVPTSLVLALIGVSFAYFVVLPVIFTYFLYYSDDVATIGFALGRTFDLILLLMGYLAIVFQIPLFIMLAMMMGLVTRQWLADRRLLFWGAFLGISFVFSPDPTGMAPVVVALTMIVLFEGTLLLTKWTQRGRGRRTEPATQS